MKRKLIYLDYAAATPVASPVARAMKPYWADSFANPSSLHAGGVAAKKAIEKNRAICARLLTCQPDEILFTSGGTESINLALTGFVAAVKKKQQHIISTTIEHTATLETLHALEQNGHTITLIPCDRRGRIDAQKIVEALRRNTTLISIIMAQNEIGTIQPIAEIGKLLTRINRDRASRGLPVVTFHTDACQAAAWIPLNTERLHVDLLSLDAAKMYGPKGVGLLFHRRRTPLAPVLHGGGQEQGLRSGTEPVALLAGCAAAFEYASKNGPRHRARVAALRDYMIGRLLKEIPRCILNGDARERLPNNVNISIARHEGDDLILRLDRYGIAASTGSACSTASLKPSHIIAALGLPKKFIAGSLRFTFGYTTTRNDVNYALQALQAILKKS